MSTPDEKTPAVAPAAENNKKNGRPKKEETPIEELYDLSKPIPKVCYVMFLGVSHHFKIIRVYGYAIYAVWLALLSRDARWFLIAATRVTHTPDAHCSLVMHPSIYTYTCICIDVGRSP